MIVCPAYPSASAPSCTLRIVSQSASRGQPQVASRESDVENVVVLTVRNVQEQVVRVTRELPQEHCLDPVLRVLSNLVGPIGE